MSERTERTRVGDRVTIYPRGKKKTYVADFWFNGAHCRQSLETANKKVAMQRAMKLELDLSSGTYHQPPAPKSIASAIEDYTTSSKRRVELEKHW